MNVKVLSLNILEGGIYFENILTLLKREKPDIFCLQEVFNGTDTSLSQKYRSIQVLREAFPEHRYYFSPELLCVTPEGKIDIGNAIFSVYPITQKDTHFLGVPYGEHPLVAQGGDWSNQPCNMQHCQIKINEIECNVFNIHGIWGFDGADNPERLAMSEIIIKQIKDKPKTMLMGDFNVQPNTKTIKNIEKHLTNVFKNQLTTSFNLSHKDLEQSPGYATAVVDMFFVSTDIAVQNNYVPDDDVSDHLPLVCEVLL